MPQSYGSNRSIDLLISSDCEKGTKWRLRRTTRATSENVWGGVPLPMTILAD